MGGYAFSVAMWFFGASLVVLQGSDALNQLGCILCGLSVGLLLWAHRRSPDKDEGAEMGVESVCAAYVRGEIEVDELERRLERAVAAESAGVLPRSAVKQVKPWPSEAQKAFALEFARRHKGPRASGYAAQMGGMMWTDAPGGYAVPLMLAKGLPEDQRAAVLAAELRDIEAGR